MNAKITILAVLVSIIVVSCVNDRDQEQLSTKAEGSIYSKSRKSISDTIQTRSQFYGEKQRAEKQAEAEPADTIDPTKGPRPK